MVLLRTVLMFSLVGLAMILFLPLAVPALILSFFGLRKPMALFVYKLAQGWALVMIRCLRCKLAVSGRENIIRKGSACFVSNHVGIFDIVLALALIGRPFGFIAKKELLRIPMLNIWILLLGGLFIDRNNPRKALNTIHTGIGRIKTGGAMIIFPEGTRSKGQGLLPFRPGALKLAVQAASPIIPVAISGSYDVFEKTGRVISGVPVRVIFGKPIITADLSAENRKQNLSDQIYRVIDEALKKPE